MRPEPGEISHAFTIGDEVNLVVYEYPDAGPDFVVEIREQLPETDGRILMSHDSIKAVVGILVGLKVV